MWHARPIVQQHNLESLLAVVEHPRNPPPPYSSRLQPSTHSLWGLCRAHLHPSSTFTTNYFEISLGVFKHLYKVQTLINHPNFSSVPTEHTTRSAFFGVPLQLGHSWRSEIPICRATPAKSPIGDRKNTSFNWGIREIQ